MALPDGTNQAEFERQVKRYYRLEESYDWTAASERIHGLETFFHRSRYREVLKLLPAPPRGLHLDVGCGTALITRFLPPSTIGLDLNPRNLEKARRYAQQAHFVQCDAEGAIPLPDSMFEVAVCTEMLEHLLYPERTVREIRRVLKPGGILVGSVPGTSWIWKLRWLSSSRNAFQKEPYHKHYRRQDVLALLSPALEVRKLYARNFQMNWFFVARAAKDQ